MDNGPETGCPKIFFHAFLQSVQAVAGLCSPQQTQSTFFFVYSFLTIVAVHFKFASFVNQIYWLTSVLSHTVLIVMWVELIKLLVALPMQHLHLRGVGERNWGQRSAIPWQQHTSHPRPLT